MKHTEALQQKLYDEMLGRIKENDLSVPYLDNGYWYYNRTEKGKSYPVYLRRRLTAGSRPKRSCSMRTRLLSGRGSRGRRFWRSVPADRASSTSTTPPRSASTRSTSRISAPAKFSAIPSRASCLGRWANDSVLFYQTARFGPSSQYGFSAHLGRPLSTDVKVFQEDNVLDNVDVPFEERKYMMIYTTDSRRPSGAYSDRHPDCHSTGDRRPPPERRVRDRRHRRRVPDDHQ